MSDARLHARVIFLVQRVALRFADIYFRTFSSRTGREVTWVVGPTEVASMAEHIAASIPGSFLAIVHPHPFYRGSYDIEFRHEPASIRGRFERILKPPAVLARLARKCLGFVYLSADGFLTTQVDDRAYEFTYLKKRGCKIVQICTGDDVRSQKLMAEVGAKFGIETVAGHYGELNTIVMSDGYDESKRRIAKTIDRFADEIYSFPVDRVSYIARPVRPFTYFYPDTKLNLNLSKFEDLDEIRIVHAPSSPAIKGTSAVRAAVERLKVEGYKFTYTELIGVPNSEVVEALRNTHIALNEFYCLSPGVFGVEAMANSCVLFCSADPQIETMLGEEAKGAWVLTRVDQIYGNLRRVLDHPEQLAALAQDGYDWVSKYQSASVNGAALRGVLRDLEGYGDRGAAQ